MSRRAFSLCVLLSVLAPASRGGVRSVKRTFPGRPGASLVADCYRGTIEVEVSPDEQFHLEIDLDPGTDDPVESEHLLDQVETQIKEDGPAVSLRLSNPSETGTHFEFSGDPRRVSIDCRCLVPRTCNLDLSTAFGGITVGNLAGRVKAKTKSGTIFCRRIEGDVEVSDEKGNIVLSHCDGTARLAVLLGDIRAGTVTGRVEARAQNGDIEVQHAHGGGSFADTAGNVTVGLPDDLAGPVKIEVDYGKILVQLEPKTRCLVQASAVWGRVHLGAPLSLVARSGGDGEKTLAGEVNGGGPLVTLHADGGEIRIKAGSE